MWDLYTLQRFMRGKRENRERTGRVSRDHICVICTHRRLRLERDNLIQNNNNNKQIIIILILTTDCDEDGGAMGLER